MRIEAEFTISHAHPSLPGHFPGNPVVPGVVIIDEVRRAIARQHPELRLLSIDNLKFLRPLLPGSTVTLSAHGESGIISFSCHAQGQPIAKGRFRLSAGEDA